MNNNQNNPYNTTPDNTGIPVTPLAKNEQAGGSVAFRTSMKGYNREDVNAYIENMTLSFNRARADIIRRINELEAANAELKKQVEEAKGESGRDAEASNVIIERQSLTIDALNAKIAEYESAAASPKPASEPLPITDDIIALKQKAEAYEKISTRLGDILMFAKAQAEDIIDKAERSAESVRSRAIAAASKIQSELSGSSDGIIGNFNASLGEISDKYLKAFSESLSGINLSLENAIECCRPGADAPAREEIRKKLSALEEEIKDKKDD